MKFPQKIIVSALLLPLSGGIGAAEYAAKVNGATISNQEVERLLSANPNVAKDPNARKMAVDSLINGEVAVQAAKKEKLEKNPDVKAAIEVATRQILVNALLSAHLREHPIGDELVEQRYHALVQKMPKTEFKIRHILVKTKAEAEGIVSALEDGKPFAELAAKSLDQQTVQKGGELGWIAPNFLLPEIGEQVAKMKPGDKPAIVAAPIGFDVVEVQDKREAKPPKLEDVREQIRSQLQQEAAQKYVAELREKANVSIPAE